ncbi:uncharacterized protein At3g28850-like [Nymphaea colorata]|uniref:uncharacterized protein At3g28850-like n=1 Tax=Nymphaea colorata TaxID=210225 RepID=UPI00129DA757|nr:uncharacterized protein At3g28850-like [Nymphaea colorata]
MGCTTSRESRFIGATTSESGRDFQDHSEGHHHHQEQEQGGGHHQHSAPPFSRAHSLPLAVHHPPQRKGDSYHVVALTSTTYGSLVLDPLPDPDTTAAAGPPENIDAWELMHDLEDSLSDAPSADTGRISLGRSLSLQHGLNASQAKNEAAIGSPKPLWMHLSDESTSPEGTDVVSSFRRATVKTTNLGFRDSGQLKPAIASIPSSKVLPVDRASPLSPSPPPGSEGKIVVYFTSLRGIRKTYEDCCTVRSILRGLRVCVDERDVSMDSAYRKELQSAFGGSAALPQVFAGGTYVGGAEEVRHLHEVGELGKILRDFPVRDNGDVCEVCGDARFVPCENCHGSRKVYEEDDGGVLRRCLECNENGLVRCPFCSY